MITGELVFELTPFTQVYQEAYQTRSGSAQLIVGDYSVTHEI